MTPFMRGVRFLQANESYSRAGTVRGLHFQWNPYMGKLVRTIRGHMIDVVLDIRKGSPTYGKIIAYDMPVQGDEDFAEWIWVPPGFAHGNTFPMDTVIEYYCSGEYSPGCEAGLSPLADDLDWSLCAPKLRDQFQAIVRSTRLISDKDRDGLSLAQWTADERSENFIYDDLR
jgi:dTDP-4-dehydrorhamnose 3,5-epimerase